MNARRLRVELAPSAFLAILLIALHGAAALCVLAVLPGTPGLLIGALLAFLGMASAWSRALLRARSSVRALELVGPQLELRLGNGERFPAQVSERRYAGRYLVLLPLRQPVRRTILVSRDMLDADSFRRLRIWVLWGKVPAVAAKQLPA
jgi:membrane-bound toxin of toxin-antitoxin system